MRIIRTRLKVLYYGAFRPFLFEGRQPICIEKNKNHHKSISLRSKDFKTSGFLTDQGTKRSPYCRMDEAFNTEPAEIRRFKTEFGYFALPYDISISDEQLHEDFQTVQDYVLHIIDFFS